MNLKNLSPRRRKQLFVVAGAGGVLLAILVLRHNAAASQTPQAADVGPLFDPSTAGAGGAGLTDIPVVESDVGAGPIPDRKLADALQNAINMAYHETADALNTGDYTFGDGGFDTTTTDTAGPASTNTLVPQPGGSPRVHGPADRRFGDFTAGPVGKGVKKKFKSRPRQNARTLQRTLTGSRGTSVVSIPSLVSIRQAVAAGAAAGRAAAIQRATQVHNSSRVQSPTSSIAGRRDASNLIAKPFAAPRSRAGAGPRVFAV